MAGPGRPSRWVFAILGNAVRQGQSAPAMSYLTKALTTLVTDPVNYWLGILVDASLAGCLLVHAIATSHGPWIRDGGLALIGVGLYGLLEYSIHRWAYHDERSPATPGHRWHHQDPSALVAAPFFVPALVASGLWGLFRRGLGDEGASWLVGALVMGFLYYEVLHHVLHHGNLQGRIFRVLRAHHRIHHRFSDCNFGVTMTVWDWVFGTHYLAPRASAIRSVGRLPRARTPDRSAP